MVKMSRVNLHAGNPTSNQEADIPAMATAVPRGFYVLPLADGSREIGRYITSRSVEGASHSGSNVHPQVSSKRRQTDCPPNDPPSMTVGGRDRKGGGILFITHAVRLYARRNDLGNRNGLYSVRDIAGRPVLLRHPVRSGRPARCSKLFVG